MDSIESIVWLTVSVEVILYHKIKTSQDNKKHNFEKGLTFMLPLMSDLTGANAVGPNTSKKKTIVFIFHIHFSP